MNLQVVGLKGFGKMRQGFCPRTPFWQSSGECKMSPAQSSLLEGSQVVLSRVVSTLNKVLLCVSDPLRMPGKALAGGLCKCSPRGAKRLSPAKVRDVRLAAVVLFLFFQVKRLQGPYIEDPYLASTTPCRFVDFEGFPRFPSSSSTDPVKSA